MGCKHISSGVTLDKTSSEALVNEAGARARCVSIPSSPSTHRHPGAGTNTPGLPTSYHRRRGLVPGCVVVFPQERRLEAESDALRFAYPHSGPRMRCGVECMSSRSLTVCLFILETRTHNLSVHDPCGARLRRARTRPIKFRHRIIVPHTR